MNLTIITFPENNYFHEIAEEIKEKNLIFYASDAADKMAFESQEELQAAVKRAMELCIAQGYSVSSNFRRIFKSSPLGIIFDWKLSALAYNLVRLNGDPSNPLVAHLQISLLKNFFNT
ncbi:MAG TPA: damage-inducible protein D [Bacteroidia bacterium]|jgi:hypothetical protein|nr:damage-inducible protein D [Bacteroidia bacterium]